MTWMAVCQSVYLAGGRRPRRVTQMLARSGRRLGVTVLCVSELRIGDIVREIGNQTDERSTGNHSRLTEYAVIHTPSPSPATIKSN